MNNKPYEVSVFRPLHFGVSGLGIGISRGYSACRTQAAFVPDLCNKAGDYRNNTPPISPQKKALLPLAGVTNGSRAGFQTHGQATASVVILTPFALPRAKGIVDIY